MQKLNQIPVKIKANVANGSLVVLDETAIINQQVGRLLNWIELEEDRLHIGSYFQTVYEAVISYDDAIKIKPELLGYW